MPTGYTSALYEGEPQTFEQFALSCARAFGAMIEMRDESLDAPIPDVFEPSSWHSAGLAKATARLSGLEAMTLPECAAAARQDFARWQTERAAYKAEREARAERYKAMLGHALRWTPPTDEHTGLRDFMVEQLESSIKFDGPTDSDSDDAWNPAPPTDGAAWRELHVAKALRDISYHADELAKDRQRATQRTAWLRDLRRSLADETAVPA